MTTKGLFYKLILSRLPLGSLGTTALMTVRLLLAEDDTAIRELLSHHLERDGIAPTLASDGISALRHLRLGVDLALLDINLPGIDGLEIVRTIRREGLQTPLLFISARCEEIDRVIGFELGADDYIVKPFSPREVVARVRAVLRRCNANLSPQPRLYRFGRLNIDEESREARVDGTDIKLKPREFALLLLFARNPGVALSRDMLIERVWGIDFDGDARTVDVHVRRLRARLCGDFGLDSPIQTLPGFGYKFMNSQ